MPRIFAVSKQYNLYSMRKKILLPGILFVLSCHISIAQHIKVDHQGSIRTYEGIGALSAGASSKLLADYPEEQQIQIFDILFKPKFAASLQHLKVEIGGDVNSTCGSEPSHARTRSEMLSPLRSYYERGYEWQIMKEAKKRNPDILLDALQWGAPGWVGDGEFYSEENISYIIAFIKGAKVYHHLDIMYCGVWNEHPYNTGWIKKYRKMLDQNGLEQVQIIAADQCCNDQWKIAEDMALDTELFQSIGIVGDHYPEGNKNYGSPQKLQDWNIPVWNSEGGPWKSDWEGFSYLAKMYNRNYIHGKMTKNITWSLITSYYDNLTLPRSGLMTAKSPWSGHFYIEPAIWAVAHTTQFAEPGWKYIDSACGYSVDSASYVTLMSPDLRSDLSIIIETMESTKKQTLYFELPDDFHFKNLSVWKTRLQGKEFTQMESIPIENGKFHITLEEKSLYSLTTTSGQKKGEYTTPENKGFPLPYTDTFENYQPNSTPKYLIDQSGAFEIKEKADGKGKCIRQEIYQPGIEWKGDNNIISSVCGDENWKDMKVSVDFHIVEQDTAYAAVYARLTDTYCSHKPPKAYEFKIYNTGRWQLSTGAEIIGNGSACFDKNAWHSMAIEVKGDEIAAYFNHRKMISIVDTTLEKGMVGIGSSYDRVEFDNLCIE